MKDHGYAVSAMHSGMDQMNRDAVTKEFRTGAIRVLIADGLLARRMDFQFKQGLVINYELPITKENYIYRIGKASKFERNIVAINFFLPIEAKFIKEIQDHFKTQI